MNLDHLFNNEPNEETNGAPTEQSQIRTALLVHGDKLNELSELIAELRRKLEPVLRPPEVVGVGEGKGSSKTIATFAPMTSDLWGKIYQITVANDSIKDILSRLEL